MRLEKFTQVSQWLSEKGWEVLNSRISLLFPKQPRAYTLTVRKKKTVLQITWQMGKGWEITALSASYPYKARVKKMSHDVLEMIDFTAYVNS